MPKIISITSKVEEVVATSNKEELDKAKQGIKAVIGPIGTMEAKSGLRDAFIPPDGYVWMCADYCLDPESNINTKNGNVKLKDLKDGMQVYTPWGYKKCYNVRKTGKHKVVKLKLKSGEVLRCSPEHRIAVKRDKQIMWVYAKELRPTDYVFNMNSTKYFEEYGINPGDIQENKGKYIDFIEMPNIESIEFLDEEIEMMDIEVEEVHCFYANGVLVHNCQEELRMIGNLSGEVNLVNPINSGEDIHTYVAKKMFGFSDKKSRTKVKTLNFAVAYGANEYTISRKLDIPVEEAKALLDNYFLTMAQFTRWKEETIKNARRSGFVFTYFGRPRLLYKYYNSSDKSKHAFADRTAVNSPVQGFGGDLIRIDHIKLYQKFLTDKEFRENVKYALTVHDEINLFVKPAYLGKAFVALRDLMYYNPSNFKVPIEAEPSAGTCWGTQIECKEINENNKIIINRGKLDKLNDWSEPELNEFLDDYESTL